MNRALYSFVRILGSPLRLRTVPAAGQISVVEQPIKALGPRYTRWLFESYNSMD